MLNNYFNPLPFPVFFICRYSERWSELFTSSQASVPDPDSLHKQIVTNEDCWTIHTYLRLKQRNLNVSLSNDLVPNAICVVNSLEFGIRDLSFSSFIVGCRGDGPKPALANFTIVQNEENVESKTEAFIPHWPQPGLIPRLTSRGNRIQNIVFKGAENNLYEEFCSSQFRQELKKLGTQLLIHGKLESTVNWHDYSNADLVLAVRDLTEKDALVKPASKLVNAWIAGAPALLGPEAAYRQLKESPLDYIEVRTPQEALDAIRKLKKDTNLYQQIISNGFKRAQEFTPDKISQRWRDVLAGPVAENYVRWCQRPQIIHRTKFVFGALREKQNQAIAKYNRFHGKRIISGKLT
ncbi:MAG: glycosyltransferase family 1 protein [Calothrix sp. MO_167.B12]|nr:glycosyltransferase family 1 protein [Calothrix sp. MO_167.B12]